MTLATWWDGGFAVPACANFERATHIALSVVAALALCSTAATRRAHACSCPSITAATAWPLPDASDVPLDTPLVLLRMNNDGPLDVVSYALRDESGQEVALRETTRVPPAFIGCSAAELL